MCVMELSRLTCMPGRGPSDDIADCDMAAQSEAGRACYPVPSVLLQATAVTASDQGGFGVLGVSPPAQAEPLQRLQGLKASQLVKAGCGQE